MLLRESHAFYDGFSTLLTALRHLGNKDRIRVGGSYGASHRVSRHDKLRDFAEDGTALSTTRSRQAFLPYADNAAVLGIVAGEVATEADHILAACIGAILAELSRSGLATYLEELATIASLLAESATHDVLQAVLNVAKRGRLTYSLLYNFCRELAHHHAVFELGLHEARLHHLASIGNSIVESERTYRRKHRHITDTHPRQVGLAPITVLVFGMWNVRLTLTNKRKIQGNAYAFAMQTIDIGRRIVAISLIYEGTYTNITTLPEDIFHF